MAIKSGTFYWVVCDDCQATDGGAFGDAGSMTLHELEWDAVDWVDGGDWLISDDGHWCPDCRAKHESEVE